MVFRKSLLQTTGHNSARLNLRISPRRGDLSTRPQPTLSSVERKSGERRESLQSAAEESTSRQQRSSTGVFRLEKHPVRRFRNLTSPTSDGQKNTNAVANPHQTAGAKSRQPDRRQVGKAQSHTRAAVQLEESTANTTTARSSDQNETPW